MTAEIGALLDQAYQQGRREAAQEIADKIAAQAKISQRIAPHERSGVREGMVVAWIAAEEFARNLASQPPGAASNGLTASSRHPGTPEDTKPPQEGSETVDLVGALRKAVDAARKRRLAERDCPGCGQNGTGLENHRRDCPQNPAYLPEESDQ